MRVRRFDFAPGDLSQEGGDTATFGVSKLALGAASYVGGRPRSGVVSENSSAGPASKKAPVASSNK